MPTKTPPARIVHCIVRIDNEKKRMFGYQPRIYYRGGGRMKNPAPYLSKWYPDKKHGGKRRAAAKARRWITRTLPTVRSLVKSRHKLAA